MRAPAVERQSAIDGRRVFWIQDPSQVVVRYSIGCSKGPQALASVKEQRNLTLRAWSESAPWWEKHAALIREMFEPLSDAMIEDSALGPRAVVLDVASGVGKPAFRIYRVLLAARAELEGAVRPCFPEGRMRFPARAILVSGRR